ncbi:TraB/GumN family protein [Neolewinella aurantiaca]|uniref:TraB/GumN family protein n=1 Tax=Neolewinella aurantiaca TaxID=2602767 RepID=A0A5C7FIX1_9BACT|nr:TraB/GumN family protein [Neolewinella aurantiaca]TXF91191.1 TraB/GumN family protein [Neolewinella aurantiaca]
MRNFLYLLAFIFTVLISACSPKAGEMMTKTETSEASPAPAAEPSLAPSEADTALLWRISGAGLAQESYLFGTIHIIPEDDYFLPNGMVSALNDADEVVFEIDPRQMQDPMAIMGLMSKINMRGDTSLEDLLSQEQYAEVESYFGQMGLPFFIFKKMKPLFLSAMVGQDMQAMQQGGGMDATGSKSYELEMTELANAAGKEISGLETMEFQLSLFDSIPYHGQAEMLYEAVRADKAGENDGGESEMDKIVSMYKRKAIAEMASSVSEEGKGVSRFEELLLTRRNNSWIPLIEEKIAGENAKLFAVGAAHLGGDKGVIALLRKEGYTVTPVF